MLQFLHETLISSKYSFGNIQCPFGNCFKDFQLKKNFPLKVMKWWKNLSYSIPFTGHLQISFEEPAAKNSHIIQKWRKNFLRRTFFLLIFLGTAKIQIWHPCRKNFATGPKYFCWKSVFDEKKSSFKQKIFSPKVPFGHEQCRFGRHCKNFQLKKSQFSAQIDEIMKKYIFHWKIFQNVPPDT